MTYQQLTIEQIEQLNQISDPVARRRYGVLFQMPQDIQDTFVSEQTTDSVWNIAKVKYDLADRDVSKVARIIGLIFLGELPIKNFIAALQRDLNTDVKTAQDIAQDINMAIFQPVRESLMQVHGLASNTNTRIHTNDANINTDQNPKYEKGQTLKPESQRSDLENSNSQIPPFRPDRNRDYAGQVNTPVRPNVSGDAQRRREEILNKIRNHPPLKATEWRSQPPNQPRPAVLRLIPPKRNIIDLRVFEKKRHYNKRREYDGFFSA